MDEVPHPLTREEVRQMIDAARDRLELRREAMARDNVSAPARVHLRDRESVSDWYAPTTPLSPGVDQGKTSGKDLGEGY